MCSAQWEKTAGMSRINCLANRSCFFMGDNVNIATDAAILNHDIVSVMINNINGLQKCNIRRGVTMCSLADNPLSCTM